MKLDKRELDKPIVKKVDGTFATLKEVLEGPVAAVVSLSHEDSKELAIARFEKMDPEKAFFVVGKGSFTREQILTEIRRDTEAGRTFVSMQQRFVRYLLNRKEEIDVS
jgi:hypothetical protein